MPGGIVGLVKIQKYSQSTKAGVEALSNVLHEAKDLVSCRPRGHEPELFVGDKMMLKHKREKPAMDQAFKDLAQGAEKLNRATILGKYRGGLPCFGRARMCPCFHS